MQLAGIHHLTAITADAKNNLDFYTNTLGLRLVKKTVNQDDTSAYHLFYADGMATPGTDITFFDWPAAPERRGNRSVVQTGFRVGSAETLDFWHARLSEAAMRVEAVAQIDGRLTLAFEDPEGQRLALVVDESNTPSHPWEKSPVHVGHQIRGLGPITLSVAALEPTEAVLTRVMNMRKTRSYNTVDGTPVHAFSMGDGGPAAELHVAVEPGKAPARYGAGAVHHVAFRVPTFEEYDAWDARLKEFGLNSSGPIDRFYFRSLYFREPGGVLFELATDGPGFAADESMETLGEGLALPPFLEPKRR